MQAHSSLWYLPLDPVPLFLTLAPYPCSREVGGFSGCERFPLAKAMFSPPYQWKTHPRAWFLKWCSWSHHVRVNWEPLVAPPQIPQQTPGLCLTSTNSLTDSLKDNLIGRLLNELEADKSMRFIKPKRNKQFIKTYFSESELFHCIWNCTVENKIFCLLIS